MARMARAPSIAALSEDMERAGGSYRAKTVFAARAFQLDPTNAQAATRLLSLTPQDRDQETVWGSFGLAFCTTETDDDMAALGRLGANLPSLLAAAVLLRPQAMPQYVRYSLLAVGNPHNDHTVQMERVCRSKPTEFRAGVEMLRSDEKSWFRSRIFDGRRCRALHKPEDDEE